MLREHRFLLSLVWSRLKVELECIVEGEKLYLTLAINLLPSFKILVLRYFE